MSKLAKTAWGAVLAVTVLMAAPAGTRAATTVGQTFFPTTADTCNGLPDFEVLQTGRASGPSYATPSDGVLTSWSFEAGAVQTVMTLRVFRPTGTANQYQVIADGGALRTIPASSGVSTFPTRISVKAGDFVGILSQSGTCATRTNNFGDTREVRAGTATPIGAMGNFFAATGFIEDISALLEPDADNDGFGDETQDQCPGQAGPNNGCGVQCNGKPATITGTNGNDKLSGTSGPDVIVGLGGNDKLSGLAANDAICGGSGRDTLKGGKGNDKLFGQKGKDTLKGGPGKDKLKGGPGKDKQVP